MWYMHNPEPIQENEIHKNLRGYEILTERLNSPDDLTLEIVNKKKN